MNTSVPSHSIGSAPPRLPHVPRFSIRYLLAWTTLTAGALLAITRGLNLTITDPLIGGVVAVSAMAIGWLCFGALLTAWHALAKTLWPLEPGEWLILVACNSVVLWLSLMIAHEQLPLNPRHDRPIPEAFALVSLAQCAGVSIVAAIAQRKRLSWVGFFLAIAVTFLAPFAGMLASYVSEPFPPLLGVLTFLLFAWVVATLLHAPINDILCREPRHWLHQSAIALFVMGIVGLILLLGISMRRF